MTRRFSLVLIALLLVVALAFSSVPVSDSKIESNRESIRYICAKITHEDKIETEELTDSRFGCPYGAGCLVFGCDHQPPLSATWKEIITRDIRDWKMIVEWRGKTWTAIDREILKESKQRFEKKETWEKTAN